VTYPPRSRERTCLENPLRPAGSPATLVVCERPEERSSEIRRIAFLGDYLPRKCGIATFTSDLLGAVAAEHPRSQCFAVPVNDIEGRLRLSEVVRFEIEEQDLASYQRAADFLNIANVDIVCVQHEFGSTEGPPAAICWRCCAS